MSSRILITGGKGFLGKHVCEEQFQDGTIFVPGRGLDLMDKSLLVRYINRHGIDSIIHLAAACGGIGINAQQPGRFIRDNLLMGINVLEAADLTNLKKVVLLGTVCMYPKFASVPFREDDIWNGYPEETNAPYGIAKKTIMEMGNAYRQQYGLNVITLIPVNMAGEHDHFEDGRSHVIPAMIAKMDLARRQQAEEITLWGDGSASREFLYAGDCARAIRLAFTHYNDSMPVNIGTGQEITIKDLAEKVAQKVGFEGKIRWDASMPNGQPRRCLDVSRAKESFGFEALVDLDEMLDRTIEYYRMKEDKGA